MCGGDKTQTRRQDPKAPARQEGQAIRTKAGGSSAYCKVSLLLFGNAKGSTGTPSSSSSIACWGVACPRIGRSGSCPLCMRKASSANLSPTSSVLATILRDASSHAACRACSLWRSSALAVDNADATFDAAVAAAEAAAGAAAGAAGAHGAFNQAPLKLAVKIRLGTKPAFEHVVLGAVQIKHLHVGSNNR